MNGQTNLFLIIILMLSFGFTAEAMEKSCELGKQLILAARQGKLEEVVSLIKQGASMNEKDYDGYTALIRATFNNYPLCCEMLLKSGASVDEKGNDRYTALMFAAEDGYQLCCEILLKYGGSINEKNRSGSNVLMIAAKCGHQSCCEMLVEVMLGIHPFYTEEAYATLFCMKEIQPRDDDKIFLDLREPIAQRLCFIAQEMDKEAVLAEVNRIKDVEIKQALIKKYFSENEKSIKSEKP